MKKLILVLTITLIASQSFGALSVYLDRVGTGKTPAVVDVKYTGADANNLPRAFALKIKINNTALIDSVTGYKTGESTSGSPGYGIYPARIDFNDTDSNTIDSYGTPLADSGDPSPGGGEDTNNVVLEFGSLYFGDINAPATSGTLCTLNIIQNTASGSSMVTLEDEDVYRGGLVYEDGTTGDTNNSEIIEWAIAPPGPATVPTPADLATGVSRAGVSLTWTAGSGTVDSHDVYFGTAATPPFIGNQPGIGYATGTMAQGKVYYWRIDEKNTGGTTTGTVWRFTVEECFVGGTAGTGEYAKWVEYGKPDCWCCRKQCRGDADCKNTTLKPVMSPDLTIYKASFNLSKAIVKTTVTSGMPGVCADFDHKDTTLKPVMSPDLTIFKNYFNDTNASVPQCDAAPVITGPVNFWMN